MRIIDLSLPVTDGIPLPPAVQRSVELVLNQHPGPGFFTASWLSASLHTASHVNSPLHAIEGGATIEEVPLDATVGELLVLDLTAQGTPNARIGRADLEPFDADFREGDIVLVKTGWSERMFGTTEYFSESPWVNAGAAEYLRDKRPKAVAFDCFEELRARDPGFLPDEFVMHQVLLGAGIIVIDGVGNVSALTKRRYPLFVAAPLKLVGVEAAPARIFVIED